MPKLRLLSNNIWWCDTNHDTWAARGEDCSSDARAPGFVRVYRELMPDVIGLQESSAKMSDALMQQMEGYALLWGRDTPILYRTDKFELIDSAYRIYPAEIPGREGSFNNARTKSYCIAVLRCKEDGKLLCFATTHLWYKTEEAYPHSDEARAYQLGLVMDQVDIFRKKYACPAVIVGDFNACPDSPAVQSAYARGYVHAHDTAVEYADETNGHHFCFAAGYDMYENPRTFAESIDQMILIDAPADAVRRFERYTPAYYMPLSDHFPMWADVVI
ncbi:MAG: hypothetical protein E7662_11620 [Ruminococcaceae bacterium]|nr:hypothetical protein [Oscillospiraceae bacterium]